MSDREIFDNAIQIPLIGAIFSKVNICRFVTLNQICLNLQKDDDFSNDQPHFMTLDDARDLMDEISRNIKIMEQ